MGGSQYGQTDRSRTLHRLTTTSWKPKRARDGGYGGYGGYDGGAVQARRLLKMHPAYRRIRLAATASNVYEDVAGRLLEAGIEVIPDDGTAEWDVPALILLCPGAFSDSELISYLATHASQGAMSGEGGASAESSPTVAASSSPCMSRPPASLNQHDTSFLKHQRSATSRRPIASLTARAVGHRNLFSALSVGRKSAHDTVQPTINLYSTERSFQFYLNLCPEELRTAGLFTRIFQKWPASWALQEAVAAKLAERAKTVTAAEQTPEAAGMTGVALRGLKRATRRGWRGPATTTSLPTLASPTAHLSSTYVRHTQSSHSRGGEWVPPKWQQRAAAMTIQAATRGRVVRTRRMRVQQQAQVVQAGGSDGSCGGARSTTVSEVAMPSTLAAVGSKQGSPPSDDCVQKPSQLPNPRAQPALVHAPVLPPTSNSSSSSSSLASAVAPPSHALHPPPTLPLRALPPLVSFGMMSDEDLHSC